MAITRAQLPPDAVGTTSPQAPSWTMPTAAGNHLVAAVTVRPATTLGAITAPAGWTLIPGGENAATGLHVALYYIENAASRSGAESFSYSQSVAAMYVTIAEYAGILDSGSLDVVATASATSTTLSTGTTATTAQATELLWGLTSNQNSANQTSADAMGGTATGGTLAKLNADGAGSAGGLRARVYEQIVTGAGTAEFHGTIGSARLWKGAVATFKASPTTVLVHGADARVLKTATRTHGTDAVVAKTTTKTHTTDALIRKTVGASGAAASPMSGVPGRMEPGFLVPGLPTLQASGLQHSTDAVLRSTLTRTHTVTALLLKTGVRSHSVDAVLKRTASPSHQVSAVLLKTSTPIHQVDAHIRLTTTKTQGTDAYVVGRVKPTHGVDALILQVGAGVPSHYADALLQRISTPTHSADGIVRRATTLGHGVDAQLQIPTVVITHGTDARIVGRRDHQVQAVILRTTVPSHDTDAHIVARLGLDHATDAWLVDRGQVHHGTDAHIQSVGTTRANVFPDAELLVTTILRNGDWSGFAQTPQIGTRVPSRALFGPGVIRVQRLGGQPKERHRLDQARIQIDVWATDQEYARQVADHARQVIVAAEGQHWDLAIAPDAWLAAVDDGIALMYLYDDVSQQPRYVFDLILTIHAA